MNLDIFTTDQNLPISIPSRKIFGGLLLFIQTHDILRPCLLLFVVLLLVIILKDKLSQRLWLFLSLFIIVLISVLISLKVSQGWDELFINLKHSYVLSQTGRFSCNTHSMTEATADFLPFFLIGLLGKLGFPLVETALSLSLLGNILVILASYRITLKFTKDPTASVFFALGAGILPCVVYVGGTGFTAVLFSGIILWIVDCLFLSIERRKVGLLLLSLLTLVRIEGVILAALFGFYLYFIEPWREWLNPSTRFDRLKKTLKGACLLAGPFVISVIIRKLTFGEFLPIPVIYKNTVGDHTYLMEGINQLRDTIKGFKLKSLFEIFLLAYLYLYIKKKVDLKIVWSLIILGIFSMAYFVGGGDWFPMVWNRYMMPFTILFVLISWSLVYLAVTSELKYKVIIFFIPLALIIAPYFLTKGNNYFLDLEKDVLKISNRWGRIDDLAYVGRFLRMTTPENTVICSSEMATVMYFADRDLLDLMGIANPEVAYAPLIPISPGNLLHRRHNPKTIDAHRPGIIYFYQPVILGIQHPQYYMDKGTPRIIAYEFYILNNGQNSDLDIIDVNYYRAGPLQHLILLGYHYLVISTPQGILSYLVNDSIYQKHLDCLKKLGIRFLKTVTIPYIISPSVSSLQ